MFKDAFLFIPFKYMPYLFRKLRYIERFLNIAITASFHYFCSLPNELPRSKLRGINRHSGPESSSGPE